MACRSPMGRPSTSGRASSSVWRIFSPPGTSPRPVWPASSVTMTMLRVKKGACAPERFSSMPSRPATGTTRMVLTTGAFTAASVRRDLARFDQLLPARVLHRLEPGELLRRVADDLEALRQQLFLHGRVVQRGDD